MKKQAVIIGSDGYIGSALYKELQDQFFDVHPLDISNGFDATNYDLYPMLNASDADVVYCCFGKDHHIISNAAEPLDDRFSDFYTILDYFKLNVDAVAHIARYLEQSGFKGSLVVLNSIYGKTIPPMMLYDTPKDIGYSVSKYALTSLLRQLSFRVGFPIVNVILAPVENPLLDQEFYQRIRTRFPGRRLISLPHLISQLVLIPSSQSKLDQDLKYKEIDITNGFV